jgi:hypothetical protein
MQVAVKAVIGAHAHAVMCVSGAAEWAGCAQHNLFGADNLTETQCGQQASTTDWQYGKHSDSAEAAAAALLLFNIGAQPPWLHMHRQIKNTMWAGDMANACNSHSSEII